MNTHLHIPTVSRLTDYVTMVWEVDGQTDVSELILPQGIIEIVFNFAEQVNGIMPNGHTIFKAPRCFIQGIHTHTIQSEYIGRHHLLGIRLRPHRIKALLGVLPAELNNSVVDLTLIRPRFDRIWHQLAALNSFDEKIKLLETELPDLGQPVCDRSAELSNLFLSNNADGFQSVNELARRVYYSPRQLNRVVHNNYGISAEELTIYKKFVESIKLIHVENKSLTDIAYSTGFYDQAHFCRVFKSYSGMTPNQYKKAKGSLPFHILS